MQAPKIPANENQRLQALYQYNLPDNLQEEEYDAITKLASQICEVPVSVITLIDRESQFVKSSNGFGYGESPRQHSFCGHAIYTPDTLMEVPDARKDNRFFDNPYVVDDPNVVFYAGMPLRTPEGFALGTLCVFDNKPNSLNTQQREALQVLAFQVVKLFELRRRNLQLENAQQQIAQYAQRMEEFAATASHDLKEPLRMINSFLSLLKRKYGSELDAKANEYIDMARDGSSRMTILIESLLEYSKIDPKKETKVFTDVLLLVEEMKKNLRPLIFEAKARIETRNLPQLQTHPTAMLLLIQNLVSNSLKYRDKSRQLEITIAAIEQQDCWEFSVADNGIGIAPEDHETIFKLFKRLHSKEVYSGSGMGLATCKKIVEQFGGKIYVKSKKGNGSMFIFTYPK